MNSTFRARWLANSEVISQVLFTSEQPKKNKMAFVSILSQIKLLFGPLYIYSACVVYTKTIIHLRVDESGGYLPPLRWIVVNYILIGLFHFTNGLLQWRTKSRFMWYLLWLKSGDPILPIAYSNNNIEISNNLMLIWFSKSGWDGRAREQEAEAGETLAPQFQGKNT